MSSFSYPSFSLFHAINISYYSSVLSASIDSKITAECGFFFRHFFIYNLFSVPQTSLLLLPDGFCLLPFILMFKAPSPYFDILCCNTVFYRSNFIIPNASSEPFIYWYLTVSSSLPSSLQPFIFSLTIMPQFMQTAHLVCCLKTMFVIFKRSLWGWGWVGW